MNESLSRLKRLRAQAAFSLIEVTVAISVLMVVLVGIFGSMTMGLSVTQISRENLRSTQIMLDKMEGLRLYDWSQVTDTNFLMAVFTNWFYETNSIGQSNAMGNGIQYVGTVTVSQWPFNTAYSNNMRQVTVTVGWSDGGINRTRSMSTYVSLSGLQNYIFSN